VRVHLGDAPPRETLEKHDDLRHVSITLASRLSPPPLSSDPPPPGASMGNGAHDV